MPATSWPMARWARAIKRQRTALAVVVGAQDEQHVLDRDDHDQRPEDERHDAEDHLAREGASSRSGGEGLLQGIERARADVAVHDPERAERQRPERRGVRRQRLRLRRCFGGQGLGLGGDGHHGPPGARPSRPAHQAAAGASCGAAGVAPSKGGDVARSLSLDLAQLRFHKRAEDGQGEAPVLKVGDVAQPVRREPADTNRAVPGVVTPGELVNVHVGQFPADQPQP